MSNQIEYRGLLDAEVAPMSDKESTAMIKMTMAEMEHRGEKVTGERIRMINEMDEGALAIFRGRLEGMVNASDGKLEDWQDICTPELMLCILSFEANDSPGNVVLWAYTVMLMSVETGAPVSLDVFARNYFPFGIPTKKAYGEAWGKQKGPDYPMGNYLDSMDAYQALADARCGEGVPA